jgi:hypothetical protein
MVMLRLFSEKKSPEDRLRLASAAEMQNFRSVPPMETAASRVMVKPTLPSQAKRPQQPEQSISREFIWKFTKMASSSTPPTPLL